MAHEPPIKRVRFLLRELDPEPNGPDQEPVRMTVVHVMPFLKYPEVRAAGQAVVQRYVNKAQKAGFDVQEAVRIGKPADEILKAAKQHKPDLIVTGAKGVLPSIFHAATLTYRPAFTA